MYGYNKYRGAKKFTTYRTNGTLSNRVATPLKKVGNTYKRSTVRASYAKDEEKKDNDPQKSKSSAWCSKHITSSSGIYPKKLIFLLFPAFFFKKFVSGPSLTITKFFFVLIQASIAQSTRL